jgi:hypothetical protein
MLFCNRLVSLHKMKKIVVELHYLASVEYYANLLQYDEIIIEAHENFIKSTNRNRCYIAGANGKLRLTIPLKHGRDQKALYRNIEIDHTERWRAIHWNSIISAYKHAPYFEHYAPYFEPFYIGTHPVSKLFDWNLQLLQLTLKLLKAEQKVSFTSTYQKIIPTGSDDCRNRQYIPDAVTEYHQVFIERNGFLPYLSILDLLMNKGNETKQYLTKM